MPTYAPVPGFAERKPYPRALIVIVAAHAAAITAVMLAKMDLPVRVMPAPTEVDLIPLPKEPPPNPPEPRPQPEPGRSVIDRPVAVVPVPVPSVPAVDATPTPIPDLRPDIGTRLATNPAVTIPVVPPPVRTGPRFATPDSRLRPPYPLNKIDTGEEAALRLRLSIDERGRVTAVEPVGSADPSFLGAARRHLIAHWRYRPATEGGRPVASSTVITLRFELER
ncbi:MAG TPA: energy transducer TonB [Sphingomicrobium sp.]|nr:energy transducer TonB [Sphingomicrobium sp.]